MTHAIPLMFSTSLCNIGKAGERSENERSQWARKGLFSFVFLECALSSFARPLFWSSQLPRDPETGPFSTCCAVKPSASRRREGVEVSKRAGCWFGQWVEELLYERVIQYGATCASTFPYSRSWNKKKLCLASFCFSLSWLIYWTCIIFKNRKHFPCFCLPKSQISDNFKWIWILPTCLLQSNDETIEFHQAVFEI